VTQLCCVRQLRCVFSDLSFELFAGELLLIEGPNGSGKSSLLRLLTGLSTPDAGDIIWRHQPIQTIRTDYAQALHYLAHSNGIKLGLTVIENLQLAKQLQHISTAVEFDHVLTQLQLNAHQHVEAHALSAGQKRRITLAKLFLFPKPLWILDEPLTALDDLTQQLFIAQLEKHLHQGGIAIMSSHHAMTLNQTHIKKLRLNAC